MDVYQNPDHTLYVNPERPLGYDEFWDEAGGQDLVTASEISEGCVAFSGSVFSCSEEDMRRLLEGEAVTLSYLGRVSEIAPITFKNWYYGIL